ncbi:hypothetical protein BH23ACT2_BH23ACT2_23320 [soil metagenome]
MPGPGYTQDWRVNQLAAGLNVNRKRIDYVFWVDSPARSGTATPSEQAGSLRLDSSERRLR